MSLKRRILRQGGVTRKTHKMVLSLTVSTYPDGKGEDGEPKTKQDAHLNVDCGGLTDGEALRVLNKALSEVQQRMQETSDAARHEGARMLDGLNVMAPSKLGERNGAATLPSVRTTDPVPAADSTAGHPDVRGSLTGEAIH